MQKSPGKQLWLNLCQRLIVSLAVENSPMKPNGPSHPGDVDHVKNMTVESPTRKTHRYGNFSM